MLSLPNANKQKDFLGGPNRVRPQAPSRLNPLPTGPHFLSWPEAVIPYRGRATASRPSSPPKKPAGFAPEAVSGIGNHS